MLVPRPDVVFVYHPPLTIGFPAYVLSRIWRVPFVLQVQDMWPETLRATNMLSHRRVLDAVNRFANWVYKQAAAICVISPGFRQNLLAKGVPDAKIRVISNWIDPGAYPVLQPEPALAMELGLSQKFNIMFAGNMGEAQGLTTVVEAAHLLQDLPAVQFVLVGDGVAEPLLHDLVREQGLNNVRFLGRYPSKRCRAYMRWPTFY